MQGQDSQIALMSQSGLTQLSCTPFRTASPGRVFHTDAHCRLLILCVGKSVALHHGSCRGGKEERKFHNLSKGEVGLEAMEEG